MTVRFYILPIERSPDGMSRGPKYFKWRYNPSGIDCRWGMKDMGSIDMAVLCADILDADHADVSSQADVYALPLNLDATMTLAERGALNTYLEAHGIPGDWLAAGETFRSALRIVTAMMLYLQRVLALIGYPQDPFVGLTLNTQYRNIPNPLHDALSQAAAEMSYAWSVANNTQVRRIFKLMADQWGARPIIFSLATL